MKEKYYLGAYWGGRATSRQQMAERSAATLQELRACHPLLMQWNELAMSYAEARRLVVEPTPEAIEPVLTTDDPDNPTRFGHDLWL